MATAGMQQECLVEPPPYTGYTKVERAQLWVYPDVPKPAFVLSEDTRGFHETVADSPENQPFHWNHNVRSYFRVGLSLGNKPAFHTVTNASRAKSMGNLTEAGKFPHAQVVF